MQKNYIKMAKDPAFLFYSNDFITGTLTMTHEDRGKYIYILCIMHQQGRLSEETIRFIVGSVSVMLKSKFSIDENGMWYNPRMEKESEKRKIFIESRINNGKKGGRPKKTDKPLGKPLAKPLGEAINNLTEDDNEDINKGGVGEKDFSINESHSLQIVNHQNEHQTWIETLYRNFKLANKKLGMALKDFNDSLIKYDTVHTNISEYKRHFINWMHTQESKGNLTHLKK